MSARTLNYNYRDFHADNEADREREEASERT